MTVSSVTKYVIIVTDFMNEMVNSEEFRKLTREEQESLGEALGAAAEGVSIEISKSLKKVAVKKETGTIRKGIYYFI